MDKNEVLKWLERHGTRRNVEGMARYGIVAERAFGVTMGTLLSLRKRLGKDHALATEEIQRAMIEEMKVKIKAKKRASPPP